MVKKLIQLKDSNIKLRKSPQKWSKKMKKQYNEEKGKEERRKKGGRGSQEDILALCTNGLSSSMI